LAVKNSFLTNLVKGSILNSPTRLEKLARLSGWQIRKPKKFKPIDLVHGLLAAVTRGHCSFRLLACSVGERLDKRTGGGFDTISKPALWERVGPEAVCFLRSVLAEMIKECVQPRRDRLPALPTVTRVIVEDSAILNLDERLADIYPAVTNQHATGAGVRLQAAFDLITGDPLRLDLTSYKRNDQSATGNIIPLLRPGDLLLRDLGFFAYLSFAAIVGQGADYLSRLLGNCVLHHAGQGGADGARIDLSRYLGEHAPRPGDIVDIDVVVGSGQKDSPRLASRLVACRVPKAVEEKRLRRLGQAEKRRGEKYSAAHRRLLGWAIYITSLSREDVPAKKILQIYPMRWRIEIIFKACKSHTALRAIAAHRSNVYHVKAMLYAWVCALVLATAAKAFALAVANCAGELRPNYLSLLKVVPKVFALLRDMISMSCAPPAEIMGRWSCQMDYHDRYEPRKKRSNMAAMLGDVLELPDPESSAACAVKATELLN
jgi:Transposase DDE domain